MKRNTKLYNMVMPIWLLIIFPFTWVVILPLNYLIDTLVLKLTMKKLNVENRKEIYKMTILKTWICGFLADFIGATVILIPSFGLYEIVNPDTAFGFIIEQISQVMLNPFDNVFSFLIALIATIVAAYFIYLFNYKIALKKAFEEGRIDESTKKKIAISMAVFTAPYVFFLPAPY
ncbi:MAG: hypothetical protein ACI3VR_02705 [Intestinibacter sp.]|uniref:hypothetical protein n=1 Tax=Intestinibacter sp. TaxID=1965304 RepID=UPI003F15767B